MLVLVLCGLLVRGWRRTNGLDLAAVVVVLSIVFVQVMLWWASPYWPAARGERFLSNVSGLGYKGVPWDASIRDMLKVLPDAREVSASSPDMYTLRRRTALREISFFFQSDSEGLTGVHEEWSSGGYRSGLRRMEDLERAGLAVPAHEEGTAKIWRLPDSLVVTLMFSGDGVPEHFGYRVKRYVWEVGPEHGKN